MSFYLGIPIKKGLFCSPLRKDNTPTCAFYRNKQGDLIFKDFNGSFYGNFISVVMYKYGLQYGEAVRAIANDFNLIKTPGYVKHQGTIRENIKKFEAPETALIQVEIQDFLPQFLQILLHSLQKSFAQLLHFDKQIMQGFLLQEKHFILLLIFTLKQSLQKIFLHNLQL